MRKLRLAAAVSLVLASPGAFALGLGGIEMRSALNQPMNAEIKLTSVKPGELDGMIVKLASADAFSRAGIERSQSLQDLRFSVDASGGAPVIRITSSTPVVEPFLNFLLEVDWPQGRMVREYTVLLDPPVFLSQNATSSGATLGDSPAQTRLNDNTLVAPAPIDRDPLASTAASSTANTSGNAAQDDFEFEVELVGTNEVANDAGGTSAEAGEVVSLDGLNAPANDTSGQGEIVSLTDLAQPNTDAELQRAAEEVVFAVEIAGTTEEVSNDTLGSADIIRDTDAQVAQAGSQSPEEAGEVISLDEFDLASSDTPVAGSERTVQAGDTLYEIASEMAPDSVSVEQMMLALLSANESAFIEGNINLVRAGAILRVPDAAQAASLTQSQAVAEVASQSQLWQEYRDSVRDSQATSVAVNAVEVEQAPLESSAESNAAPPAESGDTVAEVADAPPAETSESIADADTLSADALAILDQARQEIRGRDELRIVGEDTSSSSVADAGEGSEGAALADIERRLQLAREELSSTRLESQDLGEQAGALNSTTENLDALVTMRQNEIAALEQRLSDARNAADNAADEAAASDAATAVDGVLDGAIAEAADSVADAVSDTASDVVAGGQQALNSVQGTSGNVAPTEADENAADAIAAPAADPATTQQSWFEALLADPRKMAVAGVGGLALLGALGTLLFRRRKSDEELLADNDEVEFLDDDGATAVAVAANTDADLTADVVGVGAAASAGAALAAANTLDDDATAASYDDTLAVTSDEDDLNNDDTISEAEVYLAYGLHGQAEELLTGAIAKEPDNQLYARKLLDTYNAQGNGEAFAAAATDYHARFGGDASPDWADISAMGHELRPQETLFAGAAATVAAVGAGKVGGDRLGDDDFGDAAADDQSSSVSREFGAVDEAVDFGSDNDISLLDQSVDPAFAFDEADLEATGDFTKISDEIAAESDNGTVDFPDFDDMSGGAKAAVGGAAAAAGGAIAASMDSIDAPDLDALDLSSSATAANEKLAEAGTLADDLTLDLDQLTSEISLDGTELLGEAELGSVDDIDLPDITADNDLLPSDFDLATGGADVPDEMDTVMDLAKAYIDMGDKESASTALGQVVKGGTPDQVSEAESLLRKIVS